MAEHRDPNQREGQRDAQPRDGGDLTASTDRPSSTTISRRRLMAAAASAAAAAAVPLSASAAQAQARHGTFSSDDVPVLLAAMRTVPHLVSVAAAVKLVRYVGVSYPIAEAATHAFFGKFRGRVRLAGHLVTVADAMRFLPDSFFPIESEDDLVIKLLIAFQRSDFQHSYEASLRADLDRALHVPAMPAPRLPENEPVILN